MTAACPEPARYAGPEGTMEGGVLLDLDAYRAEFGEHFTRAREFWKLERGQHFAESGSASWEAFARGDWQESLRLTRARRSEFAGYQQRALARGMTSRRVRVVALPPSTYVQWEMGVLLLRDEYGHRTRVVLDTEITEIEGLGQVPEIVTLDDTVLYQVVYDADGAAHHAVRWSDPELVAQRREVLIGLYELCAEPVAAFYAREIAPLLPPGRPAAR